MTTTTTVTISDQDARALVLELLDLGLWRADTPAESQRLAKNLGYDLDKLTDAWIDYKDQWRAAGAKALPAAANGADAIWDAQTELDRCRIHG